jgi:hypothetical protein
MVVREHEDTTSLAIALPRCDEVALKILLSKSPALGVVQPDETPNRCNLRRLVPVVHFSTETRDTKRCPQRVSSAYLRYRL